MKKSRTEKGKTADALRELSDSGATIEWNDNPEGYEPKKTKQKTLNNFKGILIIGAAAAMASLIGTLIVPKVQTASPLSGIERASPADRTPYGYKLPGTTEIRIADTNSMDPVLDAGDTALGEKTTRDDLQPGDIITYYAQDGDLIIHRIQEIGEDGQGWYTIVKGDNNDLPDPKVRWEQVDKVIVGILY